MRLCKDSTNPPSHGWPGGMNAWSVSCSLAQRPTAAAMITSASNKLSLPLDTPLEDWRAAGLTKASLVRVDRIALLPPTYLGTAGRIGRISPRDAHRVSQALAALPPINKSRPRPTKQGRGRGFESVSSAQRARHSHSMVAGGLEVTSRTTRLTSGTELVMRVEMRARTS